MLAATNVLQTVLQRVRLNFLQVPEAINKLISLLESKQQNSSQQTTSNFHNVECFFEIASRSDAKKYHGR